MGDSRVCARAVRPRSPTYSAALMSHNCMFNPQASLMDTVVLKNVNPIEKLEHSSLLLATTIHDLPAERLLRSDVLA